MITPHSLPTAASVWRLWLVALILAVCDTWIDFQASPGLNWFLTAATTSLAFSGFLWMAGKPLTWERVLPLILACLLAGGAALSNDSLLLGLTFICVLGALATGLRLGIGMSGARSLGALEVLSAPASAGRRVLGEAGKRIHDGTRVARTEQGLPIVRGVALAIPVTLAFALLLSNAEPLMAYWRGSLLQALEDLSFLSRLLCFAGFATLLLGALGGALSPAGEELVLQDTSSGPRFAVGRVERLIILGAVGALFALFFMLQVSHFFGNAAAVRGSGVTYAQAAHEGFGELTVVATLCGALLIWLTTGSRGEKRQTAERLLCALIILQAQLLLVSAFYRIDLYEDVYGFTELRLYVQYYAGVVFIALALLGLEILGDADFRRLARHWAVTAMLALIGLLYWNHAAWIARANFERYEARDSLDMGYLVNSLGPDAVPEIVSFLPRLPEPLQGRLRTCLQKAYSTNWLAPAHRPWYEWNYRRAQLASALRNDAALVARGDTVLERPTADTCVW